MDDEEIYPSEKRGINAVKRGPLVSKTMVVFRK